LNRILDEPDTKFILQNAEMAFFEIDRARTGSLDFGNLRKFFEETRIKPRDTEIIAILRIIDVNDDGRIFKAEFDYFLTLFSGQ
jgi:Ca2+-binding EF-hand superfamily protein